MRRRATCAADHVGLQRREWLGWAAGLCAGNGASAQAERSSEGLGELALRTRRHYGFAVDPGYANNEPVRGILRRHCGIVTAENAMKWNAIENIFGVRDYTRADRVAALAARLGVPMRGHTLAWHQSTPRYLANASADEFVKTQTAHLQALMLRYEGRIHTWDVLNEVIDGERLASGGMRESVLSARWGIDRYPELFELARAADPDAKLAYNDYGMEQDNDWCERRRTAVLRMLEGWIKRKVPIDVMGLQAHLDLSRLFSATRLTRFIDSLRDLGLVVQITELDVRDADQPGGLSARDASVAALYKDFLSACLSHPAVEMIVMWNVTDNESWINHSLQGRHRADGQPMRPALFDADGKPKAAFDAVASALIQAEIRFDKKVGRHV
jgi:endo-1,4-beta-xylanase